MSNAAVPDAFGHLGAEGNVPGLRLNSSQSPGLPSGWSGPRACLHWGGQRPAANMKCILWARHVDPAVLTAISRPPLLPSQFLDAEAEASQTCLRSHRLALPHPYMTGEMIWALACPRGIGTCSLHPPPSSHATDTLQHCELADLHKPMRTLPYTQEHPALQQSSNMQMSCRGLIGHMYVQLHGFMTYMCKCKLHITFLKRSILYFYSPVPPPPAMGSPHFTPRHKHSPAHPLPFLHPSIFTWGP